MSKWFINVRQDYINNLWWRGLPLSRRGLCEMFDISPQQASNDIKLYIENHPDVWFYDASSKTYKPCGMSPELEAINGRLA